MKTRGTGAGFGPLGSGPKGLYYDYDCYYYYYCYYDYDYDYDYD